MGGGWGLTYLEHYNDIPDGVKIMGLMVVRQTNWRCVFAHPAGWDLKTILNFTSFHFLSYHTNWSGPPVLLVLIMRDASELVWLFQVLHPRLTPDP